MSEATNETITLLHSSPVAAHVLVARANASYYPYPQERNEVSLSGGAIAGIVSGVIISIIVVCVCLLLCWKKNKKYCFTDKANRDNDEEAGIPLNEIQAQPPQCKKAHSKAHGILRSKPEWMTTFRKILIDKPDQIDVIVAHLGTPEFNATAKWEQLNDKTIEERFLNFMDVWYEQTIHPSLNQIISALKDINRNDIVNTIKNDVILNEQLRNEYIREKEVKMLQAENDTCSLLNSSPVAAHVLVACTNSSYYPYPKEVQDLPPTRTLMLLQGRPLSLPRGVELRRDHLIIQTKGLYLIYSQIYFKVIHRTNWPMGLNVLNHMVEKYKDGKEIILQNTDILPKNVHPGNTESDFHTSYISDVVELEEKDEVYVRASEDMVSLEHALNYLGLVKLDCSERGGHH